MNQKPTTKGQKMKSTIIDELKYRRELLDKALAELQAWNHNSVLRVKISSVLAHDDDEYQAEHTALLAVAEVLKRVETIPHFAHESVEATRGTKVFAGRNKLADDIRQALATLAQIQKGE